MVFYIPWNSIEGSIIFWFAGNNEPEWCEPKWRDIFVALLFLWTYYHCTTETQKEQVESWFLTATVCMLYERKLERIENAAKEAQRNYEGMQRMFETRIEQLEECAGLRRRSRSPAHRSHS